MMPKDPYFPGREDHPDYWLALKLPVGLELQCFEEKALSRDLPLPVFEEEGLVITFPVPDLECHILKEGDLEFSNPAGAGFGILTSPAGRFFLRSDKPGDLSVIRIFIPLDWIARFLAGNPDFNKITEDICGEDKAMSIKLSRKQAPLLPGILSACLKDGKDLLGIQNQALSLLEYFLCNSRKNFLREELSPALGNDEDLLLIREVESYISEYFCSDTFTVDSILKKTYTSYHKLNFLFKSIHGMTISEYIRNKRIERSKEMIADNAKSISQIAYEIGYSSISNYILAFKKIYRITPGKYKKQIDSVA